MGTGRAFCRVTTRAANSWPRHGLRRGLGPLAARLLGGGVLPLHFGVPAPLGLPATSLPTTQKPAAFRVLAIALVPALRLIPPAAAATMADSWTRFAPAGLEARFCSRLAGAHGSSCLPRVSPRKRFSLPRALSSSEGNQVLQSNGAAEGDEKQDGFRNSPLKERKRLEWPSPHDRNWPSFQDRSH